MDATLYRFTTTSRGLRYHYYASLSREGKPTLLFCHGFPSTSHDWRFIAPYFTARGYGVIAPDMIGYGETDKPTDPAFYVSSKVSRDLVDILDAEGVEKAVAIGHDWGAKAVSRLASFFPERFVAYAFFAVAYVPPHTLANFDELLGAMRQANGYDTFGYWPFLSSDEVDAVMRAHIDSAATIMFPRDPASGKKTIAPLDALKEHLLADYKGPLASYVTQEDVEAWKQTFLKNGFTAPTCWYKIMTNGMEAQDEKQIPPERTFPPKESPIFFGACRLDYICVPENGYAVFKSEGFKDHDVTTYEFDADHWLFFSRAQEVCQELEKWIQLKKAGFK